MSFDIMTTVMPQGTTNMMTTNEHDVMLRQHEPSDVIGNRPHDDVIGHNEHNAVVKAQLTR